MLGRSRILHHSFWRVLGASHEGRFGELLQVFTVGHGVVARGFDCPLAVVLDQTVWAISESRVWRSQNATFVDRPQTDPHVGHRVRELGRLGDLVAFKGLSRVPQHRALALPENGAPYGVRDLDLSRVPHRSPTMRLDAISMTMVRTSSRLRPTHARTSLAPTHNASTEHRPPTLQRARPNGASAPEMYVCLDTPNARATSATLSHSSPTGRQSPRRARSVSDARPALFADVSDHERRGHSSSRQRPVRLAHTNTPSRDRGSANPAHAPDDGRSNADHAAVRTSDASPRSSRPPATPRHREPCALSRRTRPWPTPRPCQPRRYHPSPRRPRRLQMSLSAEWRGLRHPRWTLRTDPFHNTHPGVQGEEPGDWPSDSGQC